jgi:membrane fusion protein YbhG
MRSKRRAIAERGSGIALRSRSGILPLKPLQAASTLKLAALAVALLASACDPSHRGEPVSGTIEVDEVHVASRYGGRVEKIHKDEGDTLRAGDVLMEMDAAELKARRDLAAAQLAEMENGPRPDEIEAAKHDWEAQTANLEFARTDAKRAGELFEHKTIAKSDYDRAVSQFNALEKSAAAAYERYRLLLEGTRQERIDQARAQLAEIDAQLREMRIVAPGDSVLEVLSVKVGDVLPANREVATLLLPQHIWVRVYAPETWLGHIHLGDKVRVRVDAFRDHDFEGVVEQINRQAEFTPRNVQTVEDRIKQVFGVKIRLKNEGDKLRAGMAADVFFANVPAKPK